MPIPQATKSAIVRAKLQRLFSKIFRFWVVLQFKLLPLRILLRIVDLRSLPYDMEKQIRNGSAAKRNFDLAGLMIERFHAHSKLLNKCAPTTEQLRQILHINTLIGFGGASGVVDSLARCQRAEGLVVNLLCDRAKTRDSTTFLIKRDTSAVQIYLDHALKKRGWPDLAYLSTFPLKDMSIFENADIVHLHNLHGGYFNTLALPELSARKPVVWTLHDMHAVTGHCAYSLSCSKWRSGCENCPDLSLYPAIKADAAAFIFDLKKAIYKYSHMTVVTPSRWLYQIAKTGLPDSWEVRLIYNGIDEKIFTKTAAHSARDMLGLPKDKTIILFSADAGIKNPWKGGTYVFQIYNQLKHRDDLLFINLGARGKPCAKSPNWREVSYVADKSLLALYYSAADVLLYPTLADNCPLTVLEAMACELPIVTFDTGGVPELVEHGKSGCVAPYADFDGLRAGLDHILSDESLRLSMGKYARQQVLEKYTERGMHEAYRALYQEILNRDVKLITA